ncbi:hypothetical protein J3D48_005630 [Pseudomonas fluorescens]|uniref:hypothetical protein n=1 Tax=Pseudomonas fluorescens TaxID=294 RepID=UPI00209EC2DB|nr:hypothetical protein [Pseudomonas fluorescens]MCP1489317.1 hypothetical protein [Pseudomonas fluorescens]
MTEFMYRFRSVGKLLGEHGISGELQDQYIFFASPEQLNDPLEGYKDIYFQGDSIVWKNLIKHYLRCLINSSIDFSCAKVGELPIKKTGVFASSFYATDALNKLNSDIFAKLCSEPVINDFISAISFDRKVRRWELLIYIQTLHYYFLDIVFESLYEVGVLTEPVNYFPSDRSAILKLIKTSTAIISAKDKITEEDELGFLKSCLSNSEKQLLTQLEKDGKGREFWFFLLFEYPETFCRDIEKLLYPAWYTACFMSSCADSSIWGSYGGNHRDVCLKFRTEITDAGKFIELTAPNGQDRNGISKGKVKFKFYEVSYEKSFVAIDFFRSLGHLPVPILNRTWLVGENKELSPCHDDIFSEVESWRDNYWKNFYHAATVKLSAWNREKESRLLLYSSINNLESNSDRKLHYDFDLLEGIIFGINTPTETKLQTIKTIKQKCAEHERADFSFYQARYDEQSREIIHYKLESIKVGFKKSPNDDKS